MLRWLGVGTLAFIAFLYWQPLRSYFSTRAAVKQQSGEVRELREQKLRLERRLAESDTAQAVVDDVRRIRNHPLVPKRIPVYGYVFDVTTGRLVEIPEATEAGRAS